MRNFKQEIDDIIAKYPLVPSDKFNPENFCYWSIGDNDYAHMIQGFVASARTLGITTDIHAFADREIKGATSHPCGKFDKYMWLFKLTFLRDMVSKLDYDYYVFLDADSYFIRNPGDFIADLVKSNPVFVQMESLISSPKVHRDNWWKMLPGDYVKAIRDLCPKPLENVYNTNAGFWVVRRDAVKLVYELAMLFWNAVKEQYGVVLSEEAPLAFVGHVLQGGVEECTVAKSANVWASEWCSHFKGRLPDAKPWTFEDYMCGEKIEVNPAIIHSMHNDPALIAEGKKLADPPESIHYIAISHIRAATKNKRAGYYDVMRNGRDRTRDNDHAGMWGYSATTMKAIAAWNSRAPESPPPPRPRKVATTTAPISVIPGWEIRGPLVWADIHGRANGFKGDTEAEDKFLAMVDAGMGCGECRTHWRAMIKKTPPNYSSADAYFAWGVDRHNEVNERIGKTPFSLEAAYAKWRADAV